MFLILFGDLTGVSLVAAAALAANIMDKYVKKYESIFSRYCCFSIYGSYLQNHESDQLTTIYIHWSHKLNLRIKRTRKRKKENFDGSGSSLLSDTLFYLLL